MPNKAKEIMSDIRGRHIPALCVPRGQVLRKATPQSREARTGQSLSRFVLINAAVVRAKSPYLYKGIKDEEGGRGGEHTW